MSIDTITVLGYGIFARILAFFIKPKKKHWVFGCNYGLTYGEGSRSIMEYVGRHDASIHCTWITKNKQVCSDLRQKGVRCYMNSSLKGVWEIVKSDIVFTTHSSTDVCYAYNRKGRKNIYLMHGQATKACRCASTVGYYIDVYGIEWKKYSFKKWVYEYFCSGFWAIESDFVSYTSDFVKEQTHCCFPSKVKAKILGSPRNDILFDNEKVYSEFFEQFRGKLIVTYMPTHRLFGKGHLSPTLFSNDMSKKKWLQENNVIIIVKQHPNMIPLIEETLSDGVIIDISKSGLDPIVVAANSDVLISDYSSVWLDYMILKRPLAHYVYDDFSIKDQGIFENLYKYPGVNMFSDEDSLFNFIVECRKDYEKMRPSDSAVSLFHKYVDGNSSMRYYDELVKTYQSL